MKHPNSSTNIQLANPINNKNQQLTPIKNSSTDRFRSIDDDSSNGSAVLFQNNANNKIKLNPITGGGFPPPPSRK